MIREEAEAGLLSSPGEVRDYVVGKGWLSAKADIHIESLSGGVSSQVWKLVSGSDYWILKQALPKLNVQAEWYSDTSRIYREQAAMQSLQLFMPEGTIPQVLHSDAERYLYVMSSAPEDAVTWKSLLMRGQFESDIAGLMGQLLNIMHARSMELTANEKLKFRDLLYYQQLRIDPFHRYLIEVYPELADSIGYLIDRLLNDTQCLVHGDFSPKNILITQDKQAVLIDFEVAHWGNPVFDLAFCIAHLMLKGWALKQERAASLSIEAFITGYKSCPADLLPHLGLMLLARIDGKSPVDYIKGEALIQQIRELAFQWIRQGSTELTPLTAINQALKGETRQ